MDQTTGKQSIAQLCACRMGLAAGIVWGVGLFLLGLVTMFTDEYGHKTVEAIGSLYVGFQPDSFGGAVVGLIWGLVDGFIGVTIMVLLYNAMARISSCCCCGQSASACGTAPAEQQDQ